MIKTVGPKFRRALHFDFHTSPGVKNIFGRFDAARFADQLAAAHVEYINVAARCNMGFSYYNTKVGKKYPGLGDRDPLKEMIEACHRLGIGVTAYLNVGLDHELAADHPGWLKMDRQGRIHQEDKLDSFFRVMCYNSPYRTHFLEEIREVSTYDIEGLFVDCFALRECFCPTCMKEMERLGVDINDDQAVLDYQNRVRHRFAKEIYEATGDKKERIKLYFNGLSATSPYQTHAEMECISSDPKWGYDYFDSMAAYMRTLYEDRVYMSGRFQNSWGDLGGIKPLASMQNDLYDAMMNSFGISFGDHLHPVDGFEGEVAARITKVMEEKMAYEPYTENSRNLVEIGVIIHSNPARRRLPLSAKGAARMLKELKLPYNIYDEKGDFEGDGIKLLILEESADMGEDFKDRLRRFADRGGKFLFTGGAIPLAKELGLADFVELVGKDPRDNTYFTTEDSDMRWATYAPAVLIKNLNGTQVARDVDNMINFTWDGRQATRYRAQGEPTEYSTAVIKGNVACVSFNVLQAYAENFMIEHRALVQRLIEGLLPERLIQAPAMPKTATVALTRTETHKVFHVKATYPEHKMTRGIIEEHNYMKSAPVSLAGEYRVYALPEMTEVESRIQGGRTEFETGDILGYRAFLLKDFCVVK